METIYAHMTGFNTTIKDIGSLYPRIVCICVFFWREKEQIKITFEKLR